MNGCDLNRKWNNPKKALHSSIYYLKNYIKKLITHDKKEVAVFCDLHGHGKKCNSFIYGCDKAANGGFCSWTKVRLLPRILAKNTLLFNYQDCTFRVEPDKQHTARVVLWKEFSVTNSFTLEASFFGYMKGDTVFKYTEEDFFEIGESLMKSLLEYSNLLKQLEHDLIITKGWLKPSKLIQITGTPAADVFKRSLSLQKEEAKKKQRQDKVNQYLIKIKEKAHKGIKKHERNGAGNSKQQTQEISSIKLGQLSKNLKSIKKTDSALPQLRIPRDSPKKEIDYLPQIKDTQVQEDIDWTNYFTNDEINTAFNQINSGIDPNDLETNNEDSESENSDSDKDVVTVEPIELKRMNSKTMNTQTLSTTPKQPSAPSFSKSALTFKEKRHKEPLLAPALGHLDPTNIQDYSITPISNQMSPNKNNSQMYFTKYEPNTILQNLTPVDSKLRKRFETILEKQKMKKGNYPKYLVEVNCKNNTAQMSYFNFPSRIDPVTQKRLSSNASPSLNEEKQRDTRFSLLFKGNQNLNKKHSNYNIDIKETNEKHINVPSTKSANSMLLHINKPADIKVNVNAYPPLSSNWTKSSPRWTNRLIHNRRKIEKLKNKKVKSINTSNENHQKLLLTKL